MTEIFVFGSNLAGPPRPWRSPGDDETPNDHWDHLVKEKAQLPYDLCCLAVARRQQGYGRYMPAYLAVPFVQFPDIIQMRVSVDHVNLSPEERAMFTSRVPDRMGGTRISVSRGDFVPDVNDWLCLARFFHKNYVEGVKHEIDEFFKFDDKRIFDPHVVTEAEMSTLDGKTNYLHFDSIRRRLQYHDLSGKQVRPPDEGL